MSYEQFKQLCRKSPQGEYNSLCIDGSKKRDQGTYCICNESQNRYFEATPESTLF